MTARWSVVRAWSLVPAGRWWLVAGSGAWRAAAAVRARVAHGNDKQAC
jgi:hypothetical protein